MAVGDFNGDGKLDLAVATLLYGFYPAGRRHGQLRLGLVSAAGTRTTPLLWVTSMGTASWTWPLATWGIPVSILLQASSRYTVSHQPHFWDAADWHASNPQPITLTNSGSATPNISKIAASWNFSQTNNCPSSVPPAGQCAINVTFKPHTRDKHTGTVTITDNAPNSPQTIPLTGVGTAVSLLPLDLDFGDQQVGTTSPPQAATLTNYGKEAVLIHGIHLTGTNQRQFAQTNNCGTSVPAGGNCTISVTFTPKSKGLKTATLEVKDNGGGGPQTVALRGIGTK